MMQHILNSGGDKKKTERERHDTRNNKIQVTGEKQ